jgi:hypothetical protein
VFQVRFDFLAEIVIALTRAMVWPCAGANSSVRKISYGRHFYQKMF